jgi:alkylation response protein AidB-like acyl-CoA dehydrogenase
MGAQKELARISGSLFVAAETSARLFGGLVAGWGAPGPQGEILGPLKEGRCIGAVAVSEPEEAELAPGGFSTAARADGADYVVSGKKSFVTNAPIADWLAVAGAVGDRPAVFLVRQGSPGLSVGPRIPTLGYAGLAVAAVELREARVPRTHVLGPFADGLPLSFLRLAGDLVLTTASVGLIHRTFAAARDHAKAHRRGGRPIFERQEIRFKLAEMLTMAQAAEWLALRAGFFFAESSPEAATMVNCAKVFAAESAERVASMAMQILAGQGYVTGNVVERGYREAKFASVAGTTSEVARMAIADDLLARYEV